MNQYKILNIIGQGAFGNAYLAKHIKQDNNYVIKKIELTNKTQQQTQNIFNEVKLLQQFKHVNIVSYRQSIIQGQWLNIVMQFCSGGDLNQLIVEQKQNNSGKKLQEKKIIDWATQIALAIFYMHDKRILHRDLKTPNIFITNQKVKLGDFGISKVLDQKIDLASTSIGTPYYMSPEQYKHKPYSYKSDIWAFGCILYEMCNQKRPFQAYSLNGLAVKVLQANFAPVSQFYSKQLRQLIKKMLQKKQKDRPSILQFLQTPIIRKRAVSYLKQIHQKLTEQNGDKIIIEGVLYQAKKLGITFLIKKQGDSNKKIKPEFSADKKKQQKQRIKQQLQQQLKKLSQKHKKQKQQLKRLQQDRKNLLKGHLYKSSSASHNVSHKKISIGSNASSVKQKDNSTVQSSKPSLKEEEQNLKKFKMEEDYDMYDMEYDEGEDSDQQNNKIQPIPEDQEEQQEKPQKQSKPSSKAYEKQKYVKIYPNKQPQATIKSKFTQINEPIKNETQLPIEQKIINLKQSVKLNNEKLNTIKNELSNIDFSISSSEDELQQTIQRDQVFPQMKKKQKNPAYVCITDKINALRQSLQMVVSKQSIEKLIILCKVRKNNTTRPQIQKIVDTKNIGAYYIANQINKLNTLIDKVPIYL